MADVEAENLVFTCSEGVPLVALKSGAVPGSSFLRVRRS